MAYTIWHTRSQKEEEESVIWKYDVFTARIKEGLRSKSDELLFNDVWK